MVKVVSLPLLTSEGPTTRPANPISIGLWTRRGLSARFRQLAKSLSRCQSLTRELVPLMRQQLDMVADVWQELHEEHGERLTASVIRARIAQDARNRAAMTPDPSAIHGQYPKRHVDCYAVPLSGFYCSEGGHGCRHISWESSRRSMIRR